MRRLGMPAPAFQADTTQGTIIRLEDIRGSWLILFSHPADFTPVCTTEFIAFAEIAPELRQRNVERLGLSIDSTSCHIAWVRNIEQHFGVKIPIPVIADFNMDEILRLIDALQATDKHGVAAPANWGPGQNFIVPPPETIDSHEGRTRADFECKEWYFFKQVL